MLVAIGFVVLAMFRAARHVGRPGGRVISAWLATVLVVATAPRSDAGLFDQVQLSSDGQNKLLIHFESSFYEA